MSADPLDETSHECVTKARFRQPKVNRHEKFYVDVINLLHEAERDAGVAEGSCSTKNAPGSQVVTFLKPAVRNSQG